MVEKGVVERISGRRYILSKRLYGFMGKKGTYTRMRGLDKETNKALLLKHIADNERDGSRREELLQVLPALSVDQVKHLLKELQRELKIHTVGRTTAARWYPGPRA